jgi:hypothetical protein
MITKEIVIKMLKSHGYDFSDLVVDLGDKTNYSKNEVLTWMGY